MVTLPVDNYLPERAIMEGFEKMNYAITPKEGEALYPAWQFVEPAPKLIPEIMKVFLAKPEMQPFMHQFFVTLRPELNELSPAEVLTGKPFPRQEDLHASQLRLLGQSDDVRLKRVLEEAHAVVDPESNYV